MANDGTGATWDEARPGNSDAIAPGAVEIRDVRIGTRLRARKEHDNYAPGTVGGEHKKGSARAYYSSAAPSLRPDGTTSLGLSDDGRLWVKSTTRGLYYWDGTEMLPVQLDLASRVFPFAKVIQNAGNGSDGGSLTTGGWQDRLLNLITEDSESIITSISAGGVLLEEGMYRIFASAPAHQVDGHKIRLWNDTAGAVLSIGTSEHAPFGTVVQTRSVASCEVVLAAQSRIVIQHNCATTKAGSGAGLNVNLTGGETYAVMEIWKIQR